MLKRVLVAATVATGTEQTSAKYQEVFFQLIRANMVSRVETHVNAITIAKPIAEASVDSSADKTPKVQLLPLYSSFAKRA
jgi:hypothetical protein